MSDKPEIRITPYERPFKTVMKDSCEEDNSGQPSKQFLPVNSSSNENTQPGKEPAVITIKQPLVVGKSSKPTPAQVWGRSGYLGNKIEKQGGETRPSQASQADSSSKSSSSSSQRTSSKATDVEVRVFSSRL